MKRVEVDWSLCVAKGVCQAVAPDAISVDQWGYPILQHNNENNDGVDKNHNDSDAPTPLLKKAVALCPKRALFITD